MGRRSEGAPSWPQVLLPSISPPRSPRRSTPARILTHTAPCCRRAESQSGARSDRSALARRGRTLRKHECMIQYHLARMPMYGAHESPQYAKANELRDNIKAIGTSPARIRGGAPRTPPRDARCPGVFADAPPRLFIAPQRPRRASAGSAATCRGAASRMVDDGQTCVSILRFPTVRSGGRQSRFPVYRVGAGRMRRRQVHEPRTCLASSYRSRPTVVSFGLPSSGATL